MVLEGGHVLYEPIETLNRKARALGMPVFWLNQTLYPEDKLFEKRVVHCLEGTWGAGIVADLSVPDGDVIIAKRRYSGFFQTDLDLHLRERGIRQVIVTGVVTNICVRSTVNDAFFLGYDVYVPEDCVMATSDGVKAQPFGKPRPPWNSPDLACLRCAAGLRRGCRSPHRPLRTSRFQPA